MSTFNLKFYGTRIREWIPNASRTDVVWLANKAANIYRSIDDGCVDNFRITEVVDGVDVNPRYEEAVRNGCCGSTDVMVENPLTKKTYRIGFNYGH